MKGEFIVLMDYATLWPEAQVVNAATSRLAAEFVLEVSTRLYARIYKLNILLYVVFTQRIINVTRFVKSA